MNRIFFALLFFSLHCFGAGPVTHAYLTDRFFEYFPKYSDEEKRAFMLGSLFPDIQYIGDVTREETHSHCPSTLLDVLKEHSPFLAGVKFHCYVDHEREAFLHEQKIYDKLQGTISERDFRLIFLKLKLMEDEVIYSLENWQEWIDTLHKIHADELNWGVDCMTVRKWHNYLNVCFTNPPSTIIFLLSMTNANYLDIPSHEVSRWQDTLRNAAFNNQIRLFIKELTQHFENKMKETKSLVTLNK